MNALLRNRKFIYGTALAAGIVTKAHDGIVMSATGLPLDENN